MKIKKLFIVFLAVVVIGIIYYSFQVTYSSGNYVVEIANERKAKNEFMRSSEDSPFADKRKNFLGLNYYSPDLSYRLSAKLIPIEDRKTVVLPTSDGHEKKYLEYAFAEFKLKGELCRLLILEIMDDPYRGTLFLAFADSTSAHATYGAGRYLDLKKVPGASSITLDFNEAYNPYCAYSENYSCPFPPKENVLKVAVRAGERKYHE
jgi:uncharacterized protein